MTALIQVTSDDIGGRVWFQFQLPNDYPAEAVCVLEAFDEETQAYLVPKRDSELALGATQGVRCGGVSG